MQRIQIDHERCILCEKCAQVCTANIIREKEGKMVPKDVDCIRCGHCVAVCPAKAITLGGIGPIEEERFDKELLQKQLPLLVRQRRSMRLFKNKSVTAQDIAPIMDMVRYAPTGKTDKPSVIFCLQAKRCKILSPTAINLPTALLLWHFFQFIL